MKSFFVALLVATQGGSTGAATLEPREAIAPDHVGHGANHVPPGHKHQPHRVGGPRPGDPGFGVHTPPNRHSRGEGNEHDQTHHLLEMHYDEVIMGLQEEAKDIAAAHGQESSESHDHDLKIKHVRNSRRALRFLKEGMPDDEYEHLVSLYNELATLQHKPHERHEEMEEIHLQDADLQARHEEMTKHEALEAQIREIEGHYEHIPHTRDNLGTPEERKQMRELREKLKATDDRKERAKLRDEYRLRTRHLHDDQTHHRHLPEEDINKIKALREEIMATDDKDERQAIRAEIEDIYRVHKHQRRLHHRNPRHPDADGEKELKDEILIELRQQMHSAETREERNALKTKVRDRIHELHYGHVDEDIRPDWRKKGKKHKERDGVQRKAAHIPKHDDDEGELKGEE